jgi:glycosyltransferase involved in cell wall biosynthesis
VLVAECCRHLAPASRLDVLFLREPDAAVARLPGVGRIDFLPPVPANGDRFAARLRSAPAVRDWLRGRAGAYDALLIQHVSNAFGVADLGEAVCRKLVVFPMFTGLSYLRSGEGVPETYLAQERAALASARGVVSPSQAEIGQVVAGYGVDPARTACVPRGIDLRTFRFHPRRIGGDGLDLLYVATIKPQKNHADALAVLSDLLARGIDARLHLVGAAGAAGYGREFAAAVAARGLGSRVVCHGVVPPDRVAAIAESCHLALSVARWETFGRSIFEALAMGLPALVYEDLACVWEYLSGDGACRAVRRCPGAMAEEAATLTSSPEDYALRHGSARAEVEHLEEGRSTRRLLPVIEEFVS